MDEPFVGEVNASKVGVGAVLSQTVKTRNSILAPFLTPAYPGRGELRCVDCELLAVTVALEERRYWLEGASKQF